MFGISGLNLLVILMKLCIIVILCGLWLSVLCMFGLVFVCSNCCMSNGRLCSVVRCSGLNLCGLCMFSEMFLLSRCLMVVSIICLL